MSIVTGKQYVDRIDKLKNEIWIDGEKVEGKLSEHQAFKGILKSKAALYELQHDSSLQEKLTFVEQNERHNFAYKQPKTITCLQERRDGTQLWAKENGGTIGRSPDYINTAIMTLGTSHSFFDNRFSDNATKLYERAKKHDMSFTHTFINPQSNRSPFYFESYSENDKDDIVAAKVIDETEDGIVIHGARLLATQGGITDEILVLPAATKSMDTSYAFAFAIPSNTPGLKFLCRQSYSSSSNCQFDYPLSSQFDEVDAIVVFDHVLVPWECVLLYKDSEKASTIFTETNLNIMLLYQAVSRQIIKTEFILGVGETLANSIDVTQYQHIQEKLSEIIVCLEIMKSLLARAESEASINSFGTMVPAPVPLMTASNYYQKTYPRLVEILHLIGASGFISLPTEADFNTTIGKELEHYLQAANVQGRERVQLTRLAWDLTMSPFGSRQTQYERFFFGDPVRLSSALYLSYDKQPFVDDIHSFLK